MIKVLFVCLGNICRSPAAEAVMVKMLKDHGLDNSISCDSAGTSGYHSGHPADSRMRRAAKDRDIHITSMSRQIRKKDLVDFDYIIAMDESNFYDIKNLDREQAHGEKITQLKDYCVNHSITGVPDPYYGGESSFYNVLNILEDGCMGLLKKIQQDKGL
ncbi:MAG: low molecular weight phosphotyrosine protein phosphatase [Spirochaetota bacterium]|nr:low molecular weight phosphotyrosine protein phosphatase [Spirochaetota bacterium]